MKCKVSPKALLHGLGYLCLAGFILLGVTEQFYTRSMPETPDIASGHIVLMHVNYGKSVYVTNLQRNLFWGGVVAEALLVVLYAGLHIGRSNWRK